MHAQQLLISKLDRGRTYGDTGTVVQMPEVSRSYDGARCQPCMFFVLFVVKYSNILVRVVERKMKLCDVNIV
jgi:hypothetical protein